MRRVTWLVTVVIAIACVLAVPASAFAFLQRSGNTVTVSESIHDDLYVFGSNIDVSGAVDGDVVAFGQNITVSGDVSGDVIAAGQTIRVAGAVGGTVRAAGSDVTIDGKVGNDVVAAGNMVRTSSSASVGRDAVLAGSQVSVGGAVTRDVLAGANQLTISAPVGGNVSADVSNLTIASAGSVAGDVTYYSDNGATIAGSVAGRTQRLAPRNNGRAASPSTASVILSGILGWVRRLVGMLLFALLVLLSARALVERSADEACCTRPWQSLGIGAGIMAASIPVAGFVFLVGLLIGGWWIAFAWLAVVWLLGLAGFVVGALGLGRWVLRRARPQASSAILAGLLGVLLLEIVGAVPFVGWLAGFAATLVGTGALVLALYSSRAGKTVTPAASGVPDPAVGAVMPAMPTEQPAADPPGPAV